jgi:hypothetical protein
MKNLLSIAVSVLLMGSGLAFAQDSTPVAGNTAPAVAPGTQPAAMGKHPRFDEIHGRIKEQRMRIAAGVKSGKLTKDEAKVLLDKVKTVADQMKSDFQQNKQSGQKGLTDEQVQQLNQMLDDNSKAIYGEKHEGDSAAPSTDSSSTVPAATTPTNQ